MLDHVVNELGVGWRGVEQRPGLGRELGHRKAGGAFALGLDQHVHDRGAAAARRVTRDAGGAGDRVRDLEADAEDVGELVRALADGVVRPLAVLGGDPRDEPGESVRREQQVQGARGAQRVPGLGGLAVARRLQADAAEREPRVLVDHVEHVLAVAIEQLGGAGRADVADALQIRHQRLVARRRDGLGQRDLDLRPVALVVVPDAADLHVLAFLQVRERADQHELVAAAVGIDHREAGLLAGEADAADDDLVLETACRARPSLA